ncbi:Botcinic acid biosynthesis cluster B protein 16 [Apiospora phragmitis]|uniref:Botcinic acid biosynthesis cluster B protein 16 n=1 Tax=Apiospora phragmitis TaxID=2905665 RepID=A0ABR1T771_9PEZI
MHLILTGATGLIGSSALDAMLRMSSVTKISILSRRPVQMVQDRPDPRVNVIIHKDFGTYDDEVLAQLKGAAGCVWAIGVAQSQVSRTEYVQITKAYAEAAAKAFSSLPGPEPDAATATSGEGASTTPAPPFRFVYVAGGDTTTKPGLLTAFQARIKGETELSLGSLCRSSPNNQLRGYSVRIFYPDMAGHDAIKPYVAPRPLVHNVAEVFLDAPIRRFAKNLWAPTEKMGEFLAEVAMGRHDDIAAADGQEKVDGMTIISNADLRRFKGY